MKKFLLLMSVFALFAQNIDSKSISVDQAMTVARQFGQSQTMFMGVNPSMRLSHAGWNQEGTADYYVFNRGENQGFVIVAGDDAVNPILGYSDKGSFDIHQAPEVLVYLLEEYQNQIEWLRNNPEEATTLNYNPAGVMPICGNAYGECPHWHQFAPYNNYCPTSSSGRCVAGCAPIAFAHIMKGLQYPAYGYGSNTYTCVIDGIEKTISSNFSSHSYKYSNMRNGYNETASNAQAVSQLVFDCGVAFNTKYSAESSDAAYRNIVKGMIAYFNYNPDVQFTLKANYSEQNWQDMIYNEIDNGRPVYYFGYRTINNSGAQCRIGHAFVVDGYDAQGRVHIIWGFQPEEYNSYFDFSLMSPRIYGNTPYEHDQVKEGFNSEQGAIVGICPDTTDRGGIVVKAVNLESDTMPANDVRATIDLQALSGKYAGTLKYGIVSAISESPYYSTVYQSTTTVDLQDEETVTIDISGAYPSLREGETYYIVVWSPYFNNEWMWFLNEAEPFTIGDWPTPPYTLGDVNYDGSINIVDVTALIDIILEEGYEIAGDMDGDGTIGIADLTALIDVILGNA